MTHFFFIDTQCIAGAVRAHYPLHSHGGATTAETVAQRFGYAPYATRRILYDVFYTHNMPTWAESQG